ncbi:sugar ABC transporter ATP-binding protein [Breznakiella homolactica]|uniref:Sugar ABC transporter ATP-binding protein n=2 Tax=Breznakiella homolactica TaxID=2798577 RepID=A0A7T7XRQ3_9SPIR|nr:sugar ABC transporter ATP-binding protein [Breznakiella homolactica]
MQGITMTFPGVKALEDALFELRPGEVHALLGENGAGKSTLIKVLGGIYHPDGGDIFINGEKVHIDSVHGAQALGISIIHQELMVVPDMTIAENVFMGKELRGKVLLNAKEMKNRTQRMLDDADLDLQAAAKLRSLSIANQQMVEIIRAISFGARIIVMDEPTSSLSEKEVAVLFDRIKKLKAQGIGIIYISHRISEFDEIADRITVMRDGKYIGTVETRSTTREKLISMMVGRELKNFYTKDAAAADEVILNVENLSDGGMVRDVSFSLRRGEILGFAGLVGAGRSETMKCLFGLTRKTGGTIKIGGRETNIKNVRTALKYGLSLVPENRKLEGIYPIQNLRFNSSIVVLDQFIRGVYVDRKKEQTIAETYCTRMKVKTPSLNQAIAKLSGGNQQKVIIGRWLASHPKVLILDEPTRGIDVSAKAEIYSIINELAKEGVSIILISSELPEIINMSDRVAVMNHGCIAGIIDSDFTQEKIMHLATMDID